ncbi:conserved protein of unknown function [Rhodovastum atsumiense]|nr:DUF4337 domain-containing protein [Rhodovastum atsumiense]CAH2600063.1 conserved protein of unknown function [Rhodovastum atsumiense]
MDSTELAKDGIEHAHGGGHAHGDSGARRVAVLIAVLAAMLAIAEMGEKGSQNAYLTHHIQAADNWAFFQAKNIRATVQRAAAEVMDSLPNADDTVHKRAEAARTEAARLRDDPVAGDGSKQIAEKAKAEEHQREVAFHRYHLFELVVGALQIAIVLASVSVVTRVMPLAWSAGAIGGVAGLFGLAVAAGLV